MPSHFDAQLALNMILQIQTCNLVTIRPSHANISTRSLRGRAVVNGADGVFVAVWASISDPRSVRAGSGGRHQAGAVRNRPTAYPSEDCAQFMHRKNPIDLKPLSCCMEIRAYEGDRSSKTSENLYLGPV